jgi:GTP-binding protein
VLNASFYITIANTAELPTDSEAEVAFAGRSNAGKSSAINAITCQRRLAFVSKTPGRTQHLNFFQVAPSRYLVDLPGYGFAKAPLAQQREWQSLIGGYLHDRPQLRGLVMIMDIRHPFTDLDVQMLAWFKATGKPVHILLSKSDKLSRSQAMATLNDVRKRLRDEGFEGEAQLFSSPKHEGQDEAEAVLRRWLELEKPAAVEDNHSSRAKAPVAPPAKLLKQRKIAKHRKSVAKPGLKPARQGEEQKKDPAGGDQAGSNEP